MPEPPGETPPPRRLKIGIINELGGHLTELVMIEKAFEHHDRFYVTSKTGRTFEGHTHYQIDLHPERFGMIPLTLGRVLRLFWRSWRILRQEKPDVLVSTGAEICLPAFYYAKVLGIKTIFIETVTRLEQPTITARLVYPVSSVFLVQQPELLARFGSKARYEGRVC